MNSPIKDLVAFPIIGIHCLHAELDETTRLLLLDQCSRTVVFPRSFTGMLSMSSGIEARKK
jgi:hypothetical protein